MELVVGFASAIIIALLILIGLKTGRSTDGSRSDQDEERWPVDGTPIPTSAGGGSEEATRPCPVCGSRLRRGELVKTQVFSGGDKPRRQGEVKEAMAHMFGCKYCYPEGVARHCPVCKKELGSGDYIIARMFLRVDKKHMHVLGCTRCRTGRG